MLKTGKTWAETAQRLNVSTAALSQWKTGKTKPSRRTLYILEQAEAEAGIKCLPPQLIAKESRPAYSTKKRDKEIHSILQEVDQLKARLQKLLIEEGE